MRRLSARIRRTTILGFSCIGAAFTLMQGFPASAGADDKVPPPPPLTDVEGEYFKGSGVCAACHTQLKDEAGKDVSIDTAWRASMMGNAARDPFWRMVLRGELLANPQIRPIIEDKCSTCHMPMARTTAKVDGKAVSILDEGFANKSHELNAFALDSVSCTLCHQITPDKLGTKESYTGHYTIGSVKNKMNGAKGGASEIYGQYVTNPTKEEEMAGGSGFRPQRSLHIQNSALCGSCHNLYTPFVTRTGQLGDHEVAEQAPYTEWENSSYNGIQSCQQCHMPQAQGKVALSVSGGDAHHGFYQHSFVGANYYMLEIFRKYGAALQTPGAPEDFAANIERTLDFLRNSTAKVSITDLSQDGDRLNFSVNVKSETGHKFPSAYPARRAWLHTTVLDKSGKVVFESGDVRENGQIVGNDEDEQEARYEPHYATITKPDQVQIYQAELVDSNGVPTTTLLYSAAYAKDNRILPTGFDKWNAPADIQVYGEAKYDNNFVAGGHTLLYQIGLNGAQGPFTVETELLYQSINYRWIANLEKLRLNAPNAEADAFMKYYAETPNLPAIVSQATTDASGELKHPAKHFELPKAK